jgi:hypothetical protein
MVYPRHDLLDARGLLNEDAVAKADRGPAVVGGALVGPVAGVGEREPRAVEGEGLELLGCLERGVVAGPATQVGNREGRAAAVVSAHVGDPAGGVDERRAAEGRYTVWQPSSRGLREEYQPSLPTGEQHRSGNSVRASVPSAPSEKCAGRDRQRRPPLNAGLDPKSSPCGFHF